MKRFCFLVLGLVLPGIQLVADDASPPVRLAMAGLNHDHAMGFLPRLAGRTDVQLVGIVETNADLIARYSKRFHLDPNLFYPSLEALFASAHPQADRKSVV